MKFEVGTATDIPVNGPVHVHLPEFTTEEVVYTKIYFPGGKPSKGVISMLKSKKFIFQNPDDSNPYWFGAASKLEGTGFDKITEEKKDS